jgi:hypothetical protein
MLNLPNFYEGDYKVVYKFTSVYGVYKVSGFVNECQWGCVFHHNFKKIDGPFKDVWMTGWELKEAIDSKELELEAVRGVIWLPKVDARPNPFKEYVGNFYEKKENAKNTGERHFYKLMLNSLYGKFVQRAWPEFNDGKRIAGSMFHPFIAALITGFVNAKMHRLEHKYQSVHTATDSVKTSILPSPEDLQKGIGFLEVKTYGDCLILRNKLYVHFDINGKNPKVGLHGFQADWKILTKLYKERKNVYYRERLVKWAEAWRTGQYFGVPKKVRMQLIYDTS